MAKNFYLSQLKIGRNR